MAFLYGVAKFGLEKIEKKTIFDLDEHEERIAKETLVSDAYTEGAIGEEKQMEKEAKRVFAKSMECPLCDKKFKMLTPKAGRLRRLGMDLDLRPTYQDIDAQKYNVISCPHCGYSAITHSWGQLMPMQVKRMNAQIVPNFKPQTYSETAYTYDEAHDFYRLAMASAVVRDAKVSEKAYIYLRCAWLLRGQRERLPQGDERISSLLEEENEYLNYAFEGFLAARMTEDYPMCGMDEITVSYLIAALGCYFGEYVLSLKLIANILVSYAATEHVKDKARSLKEMIRKRVKEG